MTGCFDSNRQHRKGEGGRRWEAGESLVPGGGVPLVPAEGGNRGWVTLVLSCWSQRGGGWEGGGPGVKRWQGGGESKGGRGYEG